ncbi:MAG: 3'-5' exonuclease, partial [Gemmatimonadales bacterium]
ARTRDGRWTLAGAAADASPPLASCRFAVVDVETTGVRARRDDRIIEIAVVMVEGGGGASPELVFHSLVNPERPVPKFVQDLTGIDPTLLFNAPSFNAVLHDLLHVLSGSVFVAHNARFDWAFVSAEILRSGGLVLAGPRVCTLRLARRLLPHLERRNLDAVCFNFGIEIEGRHRAVGDAVAAARCLVRLLRLAREWGAVSLGDLDRLRIADCGLRSDRESVEKRTTSPLQSAIRNPQSAIDESAIRNPQSAMDS